MLAGSIKGLDSYRIEDAVYFFGRDGDSERLVSRVLSSRFTLLYARSGTGKTSLLQAKAGPDLERHGWVVVLTRPALHSAQSNPMLAVWSAVLKAMIPPPDVELLLIEKACKVLLPGVPKSEVTLKDLISRYQHDVSSKPPEESSTDYFSARTEYLQGRESIRDMQSPIPLEHDASLPKEFYYPQFGTLLRGGMHPGNYVGHLAALCADPPYSGSREQAELRTIEGIEADLKRSKKGLYASLLSVLDSPCQSLLEYFQRFFSIYGTWRADLRVVLVMDQFEELFTLYGDAAPIQTPTGREYGEQIHSYELRDEFFRQLQGLYGAISDDGRQSLQVATGQPLPLACVVSIRQEFIAELDPLRAFVSDLDQWSFHLERLHYESASKVLIEMTESSRWPFHPELADRIITGLTREGTYVDPAELQVVCGRILEELENRRGESEEQSPDSAEKVFEALGQGDAAVLASVERDRILVGNILDRFFHEFLDHAVTEADAIEIGSKERLRVELLEILQGLVTNLGKAPAPVAALVNAPFRVKARRQYLVDILEKGKILRTETRNGVDMAEIRHDFLIQPIQRAVREGLRNEQYGRQIAAQAVLSLRIQAASDDAAWNLLTLREFEGISRDKDSLSWTYLQPGWRWTPGELMLRSALNFGRIEAEVLAQCATLAVLGPDGDGAIFVPSNPAILLNKRSLAVLNTEPESQPLNPEQLLVVIRSHIELCNELDRSQIQYWTNRWQQTVSGAKNVE